MTLKRITLFLLLTLSGSFCLFAEEKETDAKDAKSKKSSYEKLFKGKKQTVAAGMLTVRQVSDKIYFEIPDSLFGREMLLGSTVSAISDPDDCMVGEKPQAPMRVMFTRRDSTVFLNQIISRTRVVDKKYDNIRASLEKHTVPPVFKRFSVKAYRPADSTVIVDVSSLFMDDIKELRPFDGGGNSALGRMVVRTTRFNKGMGYVDTVKAFSDNMSVRSALCYTSDLKLLGILTIAKDKPTTALVTRTLMLLPKEPMKPRKADSRIGIFSIAAERFSSEDDRVKTIHYATKWNLVPTDITAWKNGVLVEPTKPIVFYVDPAFPKSWRPAIKKGIEDWNLAFEKIGFKNAVKALDFPKNDPEFDPDNLKYSCVRYAPTRVANAMGPSWKDPRSGEILCASVYIHHNIAKLLNNWRFTLTAQVDERVRQKALPDELFQEAMRYVAAHEVGHCLGLMHNMSASASFPVDSLRSANFTKQYGTTPSIMDYARFNYVAQPQDKKVKLTPPLIGVYDDYAIKWLYAPIPDVDEAGEQAQLDAWIAEKVGDPRFRYGKQQVYARYDPSAVEEDLGDNPVRAAIYGISNLKFIMAHLDEWFAGTDPDWSHRSALYHEIVHQYKRYLGNVLMNVGGIYLYDVREGDGQEAYRPVPEKLQRESVKFLFRELYDMEWLRYESLKKHTDLENSQAELMEFGSANFMRNLFSEQKRAQVLLASTLVPKKEAFTLEEYMSMLYNRVWKHSGNLSETEKAYQTAFVKAMLSGASTAVKSGSLMIADPENVSGKPVSLWEWAYAPTPEQTVLYGLEPEADRYESLLRQIEDGEIEGVGYQREVRVADQHDLKAISFQYLMKVREFLYKHKDSGNAATKAHYRHLIYKINVGLD